MKTDFEKELESRCLTHMYRWKYCNVNPSNCKMIYYKENVLKAKNKVKKEILSEIDNIHDVWSIKLVNKIKKIIEERL